MRYDPNNVWLTLTPPHVLNKVKVSFPDDAYAFPGELKIVTESAVSSIKGYTSTRPQGGSNSASKIHIEFSTNIQNNSHVVIRFGGITFREGSEKKPVEVQFPADQWGSTHV